MNTKCNERLVVLIIIFLIFFSFLPTVSTKESNYKIGNLNSEEGLVGYWNFNEGIGTTAQDASDYGNHGEVHGAKWDDEGYSGNALLFDGNWDYVVIQDDESINFADKNEFTLDAWIKWYGQVIPGKEGEHIIHKAYHGGYSLRVIASNGTIGFCHGIEGGEINLYSDSTVTDREWYHITAVWDGINSYLYINGVLEHMGTRYDYYTSDGQKPLEIGNNWGYADNLNTFNGLIDEVRIYERALSEEEIPTPYSIVFTTPIEEEIQSGRINIAGKCTHKYPQIKEVQVKLVGRNKETSWKKAEGWDDWSLEVNLDEFSTGPLTIYACCIDNFDEVVAEEQIRIHVDSNDIIPELKILSPIPNVNPTDEFNYYQDIIEIRGDIVDNDGEVDKVFVRIKKAGLNEWEEVYLNGMDWLYELNSNNELFEDGDTYILEFKCQDNELNENGDNYNSPIIELSLIIDNKLPIVNIEQPREGYICTPFGNIPTTPDKAYTFLKIPAKIIVENPEVLDIQSKGYPFIDLVLNEDFNHKFEAKSSGSMYWFENSYWNEFNMGDCCLEAIATNRFLHSSTDQVTFIDVL